MLDASSMDIEIVDLQELARVNPLAWEQLSHIVDNRRWAERVDDLERHLEKAHSEVSSNGASKVLNDV